MANKSKNPINTNQMSELETYFSDWCFSLQQLKYIESFSYETYTMDLSDTVQVEEFKQVETKSKKESLSKISTKSATKTLLQHTSITSDFTINWTDLGLEKFCKALVLSTTGSSKTPFKMQYKASGLNYFVNQGKTSQIEIKPYYEGHNINSSIEFPIKQKWLWSKENVYIQKIKPVGELKKSLKYWYCLSQNNSTKKLKMPNSLFDLTFYPDSFFYTETGKLKHNKEFDVDLINILPTVEKWKK